ncbi:MAG: phosphodiesterase [Gammaproteobacteria bacterium]|nr:phosphodiesterase [Gammaproteobacteria bacterium]
MPASHADTLVIDAVRQAADVERPAKGQSMAEVEARFGAPKTREPAIGQPPIARWVYDRFTVYFEGDTVLHSVAHR